LYRKLSSVYTDVACTIADMRVE